VAGCGATAEGKEEARLDNREDGAEEATMRQLNHIFPLFSNDWEALEADASNLITL
jgi:hypothetical protein